MSKPVINDWVKEVHAAMLESGSRLSYDQMRAMYGYPKGGVNLEAVFDRAVAAGWFEAQGRGFVALGRAVTPPPSWRYLDKLSQVPSVFHLR